MVGRPEVSNGEEGAEKTDRHTSRKDSKRNNGSTLCLSSRPSLGVVCPHVEKMCRSCGLVVYVVSACPRAEAN